jgi:hypothetical protein
MREKELFDQLNLKFSSMQVNIGDLHKVLGNGSMWERNGNSPGRKLLIGEMLLIIEKTQNQDWVVVLDKDSNVGEVCVRVFEEE